MIFSPLKISLALLDDVMERVDAPRSERSSGKVYGSEARARRRTQRVETVVLEQTRMRYAGCKCEAHGLHEGMTIDQLIHMHGCQVAFACPRLDAVRRHYGF